MNNRKSLVFALALLQVAWAQQQLPVDDDEGVVPLRDLIDSLQSQTIQDRGYFRSNAYKLELTAAEKLDQLWQMLVPDETVVETPMEYYWKEFDNFFGQKAQGSFCDASDELRFKRLKTTHTQGIVAKVQWKVVDPAFSGIYEQGSEHAILRLSETNNLTEESDGLLPSMALKFLYDYRKSENLFGMPNITGVYEDGQRSWDFFRGTMKNRVERYPDSCERETVEKKMLAASNRPYGTAVFKPAAMATDGVLLDLDDDTVFRFPYQLEYEGVHNFPHEKTDTIWYDQLKDHFNTEFDLSGDEGVPIMRVYGWDAPEALEGNRIHIADIVLQSKLFTSREGDERLYFQHNRVNIDRNRWPQAWKKLKEDHFSTRLETEFPGVLTWPGTDEEARDQYISSIARDENGVRGCPFNWLWDAPVV